MNGKKHEFWNSRATLGACSVTYDTNLKQIEMRTILNLIPSSSSVLDVGCGDGSTLIKLVKEKIVF